MRHKWLGILILAASVGIATCASATTIGEARAAGPGWNGYLQGFVTAVFPDYGCMVIEESNRSAAIVVRPSIAYQIGVELSVQGTIQSDGTFLQTRISPTGFSQSVFPVALSNKALTGMVGNPGVSNSELLVTTWGKALDYRTPYPDGSLRFHISDGTAKAGGPMVTLPVGVIQQVSADAVQVTIPRSLIGTYPVIPGNFVRVTGIAGKGETISGDLREVMISDRDSLSRLPLGGEVLDIGYFPPVVVALDGSGDYGPETPGTTTSGLQEAINFCVANKRDLYIRSSGIGGVETCYRMSTTLTIPPAKRFTIEGGNYVIGRGGSDGDVVVIDSARDCHYRLGLVVTGMSGAVVKVRPQNPIPSDGTIAFTDSELRLECATNSFPFTPGERQGYGVLFDTTYGPVTYSDFFFTAVMNQATQISCPDAGFAFAYNRLECGHLHTNAFNSTLLHIGAVSYQNYFRVAHGVDQGATGVKGVDIFGSNNIVDIATRGGGFIANGELIFEAPSYGNHVRFLQDADNPLGLVTDLASNPTNRVSWCGPPAPISTFTAGSGTYTYTQRLYPAVIRVTGGSVSSVAHKRSGATVSYGIPSAGILLSVGDQLQITSSSGPTVDVIPI